MLAGSWHGPLRFVDFTRMIWLTAKKRAAVDFISNLVDVIKAAKNGGLIGATTETLKKVAETLLKGVRG